MRLFLTIVFILNSLIGFCQVDLFFPLKNEFDWKSVEKQNDELKAKFIKNLPKELDFYRQYYEIFPNLYDLEACLHIIDFNDDGLDDIIFDGLVDGEGRMIIIFINIGNSFVNIFTEYQELHKIVFKNGKVHKLYIQDGGCCCATIGINKIFNVDYSSKLPKINSISQMQYIIYYTKLPNNYFDKPIKFEVLNNKYNIRFSPIIDDTTEVYYCGEPEMGNSLGKIKLGSIGYALAEEVDATGRIWWFVAISPDAEIYESIYYLLHETSKQLF